MIMETVLEKFLWSVVIEAFLEKPWWSLVIKAFSNSISWGKGGGDRSNVTSVAYIYFIVRVFSYHLLDTLCSTSCFAGPSPCVYSFINIFVLHISWVSLLQKIYV